MVCVGGGVAPGWMWVNDVASPRDVDGRDVRKSGKTGPGDGGPVGSRVGDGGESDDLVRSQRVEAACGQACMLSSNESEQPILYVRLVSDNLTGVCDWSTSILDDSLPAIQAVQWVPRSLTLIVYTIASPFNFLFSFVSFFFAPRLSCARCTSSR